MMSVSDRRKEDALNIIVKWIVVVCFPTLLSGGAILGARLLLMLRSIEMHVTTVEQQLTYTQRDQIRLESKQAALEAEAKDHQTRIDRIESVIAPLQSRSQTRR
jgi:hypothetical protein